METVQKPILEQKRKIEVCLAAGEESDGSGLIGPEGFVLESDNVSLEVGLANSVQML